MNELNIRFSPKIEGKFAETIRFISEREDDEVSIVVSGGSYTAKISLEEINGEKVIKKKFLNQIYAEDCEPGRNSTKNLKIKNHAVVTVDYFWHIEDQIEMKILENIGRI